MARKIKESLMNGSYFFFFIFSFFFFFFFFFLFFFFFFLFFFFVLFLFVFFCFFVFFFLPFIFVFFFFSQAEQFTEYRELTNVFRNGCPMNNVMRYKQRRPSWWICLELFLVKSFAFFYSFFPRLPSCHCPFLSVFSVLISV